MKNFCINYFWAIRKIFWGGSLLESILNHFCRPVPRSSFKLNHMNVPRKEGYRNGTRPHQLTTRVGTITLLNTFVTGSSLRKQVRHQRIEQASSIDFDGNGSMEFLPISQLDQRSVWYKILQPLFQTM